jgi:magnesium chelatase family protein
MRVGEVRQFCQFQAEGQSLMRAAMSQLNLSARAYHRILKLSRTIADLAGSEEIQSPHLAEALQYRPKIMIGIINRPGKCTFGAADFRATLDFSKN